MKITCLFALSVFVMVLASAQAQASPSMALPRATPTAGFAGEEFTFTVSYAGDRPESVQLYVNGIAYDLLEVDTTDFNTSDGKDYYLRLRLDQGVAIYYFKATLESGQEVRTQSSTVNVRPAAGIRMDHLDVVFAVLIFLVPAVWGLAILRRLSRDMGGILEMLRKREGSE